MPQTQDMINKEGPDGKGTEDGWGGGGLSGGGHYASGVKVVFTDAFFDRKAWDRCRQAHHSGEEEDSSDNEDGNDNISNHEEGNDDENDSKETLGDHLTPDRDRDIIEVVGFCIQCTFHSISGNKLDG